MMKIMLHSSFIFLLILCSSANVYPCVTPAAPTNTTNSSKLSICEGLGTKLSVKGIGKIGWYDAPTGGKYLGSDTIYLTPILTKTTTFYVQDSTCEASATRTAISVTIKPHAIANFSVQDICERDSAIFVNLSKGAQTYKWKFGDMETSTEKSPKHFYNLIGCFPNVTLVAVDSNGCSDSISKPITINSYPKSDFTFTSNETKVTFKAKQAGNVLYKWVFGGVDSSLSANTTYTFPKFGIYNVCLNVTNAAGCFSKTCKSISVPCNAKFTKSKDTSQKFKIFLINNSTNTATTTYQWDFGDGGSSTSRNPTHKYNTFGKFRVCLTVSDSACSSTFCDIIGMDSSGKLLKAGSFELVIIDKALSVADKKPKTDFKIYPNPNSGHFVIEKTETNAISTLEIFNQIGQIVHKSELIEHFNPMNLNLANGIYLIRVTSEETRISQRMVVSK